MSDTQEKRPLSAEQTAPSLLELHRRWSDLEDQCTALELKLDAIRFDDAAVAGQQRGELERQLDELTEGRNVIVEQMRSHQVETLRDMAVMLDLSIDRDLGVPACVGCSAQDGEEPEWVDFGRVLRALAHLAPDVELTSLRRLLPPPALARLMQSAA